MIDFQPPLGRMARIADALGLEQAVERFSHRVILGIAFAANGCGGLGFGQALGVANGSILDPAVAVMDQAGDALAGPRPVPQAHVEGIQRKVGAQRGGHLSTDDHAGEHVDDERRVGPAGVRADVGQVSDLQLIRCGRDELPLDQVGRPFGLSASSDGGLARLVPANPAPRAGRSAG